jgi:putative transposase
MCLVTEQRTEIWGQVIGCAVLIAAGIGLDGKRSILGVSPALSEAEVHWRTFLASAGSS